jgi:cell division protein FtsQ
VTEPTPHPDRAHEAPNDAVLDELMVAFSGDDPPTYDFDDPSIDRILGLDDELPDDQLDDEPEDEPEDAPDDEPAPPPDSPSRRTIVIVHDEQPDPVYLDEAAEERLRATHGGDRDAERSTVVIGDLDDGPGVEAIPARGGGNIDPRIRQRRINAKRAEGRRRLVVVGIASGVVVLLVAAIATIASPLFDVRTVHVQGAVYTDKDVLAAVVSSMKGDPVLLVDTEAAQRRLEAVPWVESARVTTSFPHTVTVDIRERRALATFQGGDKQWRVIDVQGRVLDVIAGQPIAYTLVTGDNPDTARGDFAGAPYASAAGLVLALPPEIRRITRSVGVDAAANTLSMVLDRGDGTMIDVHLGDGRSLDDKLARLLQQVHTGLDGVTGIDVSTSEVGVVRG